MLRKIDMALQNALCRGLWLQSMLQMFSMLRRLPDFRPCRPASEGGVRPACRLPPQTACPVRGATGNQTGLGLCRAGVLADSKSE